MISGFQLDNIFHQIQTSILFNSPKSGNKWFDMLVLPLVIGIFGSLMNLVRMNYPYIINYVKDYFNNIKITSAKIDFEGTIHYLTYRTRVQLDLGMASFFYYIFKHIDEIEGLQYLRRIPDQQRDWDDTSDKECICPHIFEEFFIAQDKMIKLPSGLKIYPKIQNRTENDDAMTLNKQNNNIKSSIYGISVVYDKYDDNDKNMKYLLEHYKNLKDEYLEYRNNKINNNFQYVYMFSHKSDENVYFDKYSINNEPKHIEHIWFPEKKELINNIDHFIHNKDFYTNKGKPYRKVILAYGEPGCGKTSFLMALINMLKCSKLRYPRQLIHLKLDMLTRKDLMNILFKDTISVDNTSDTTVKIPFDRRIYYIEEIDGYKATHNRKNEEEITLDETDVNLTELLQFINNKDSRENSGGSENSGNSGNNGNNGNNEMDDVEIINNKLFNNHKNNDDKTNQLLKSIIGPMSSTVKGNDKLGIQDILEALDGIPSMKHGEIVFMTTNHIEKIDPALIRPGRVNHLIHFKKSNKDNTINQIEKYYDIKISSTLKTKIPTEKWTPAQIESVCDSSINLEEAVNKLIKVN